MTDNGANIRLVSEYLRRFLAEKDFEVRRTDGPKAFMVKVKEAIKEALAQVEGTEVMNHFAIKVIQDPKDPGKVEVRILPLTPAGVTLLQQGAETL